MIRKWREIAVALFLLALLVGAIWGEPIPAWQPVSGLDAPLVRVSFLDVGHGEATLIQTEEKAVLMDGGDIWAGRRILALLEGMGIEQLDMVIITSAYRQHSGGLSDVLTSMPISEVLYPGAGPDHSPEFSEALEVIREKEIAHRVPVTGEDISLGENVLIQFLTPWEDPLGTALADMGGQMLVCRLTAGEVSFLFASRLEQSGENRLLRTGGALRTQVLKVAAHGSRQASSRVFLDQIDPEVAIISVGAYNEYGLPHPEVLARLEARCDSVWRTDRHGTITIVTDGRNLKVKPERPLEGSH